MVCSPMHVAFSASPPSRSTQPCRTSAWRSTMARRSSWLPKNKPTTRSTSPPSSKASRSTWCRAHLRVGRRGSPVPTSAVPSPMSISVAPVARNSPTSSWHRCAVSPRHASSTAMAPPRLRWLRTTRSSPMPNWSLWANRSSMSASSSSIRTATNCPLASWANSTSAVVA